MRRLDEAMMSDQPSLDEWVALTPAQRNRLRREWSGYDEYFLNQNWLREEGYWIVLLAEATERFKAEFGTHPLVNHISFMPRITVAYEPGIVVTTALSTLQRIEELPDRYLTFAVYQEPVADTKRYYVRSWELTLGHFLGWNEEQVRTWAQEKWGEWLDGKFGSLFYHEDEMHYVTPLLVPPEVAERLDPDELRQLHRQIHQSVRSPLSEHPYDWDAAKERVGKAVKDALAGKA